MTLTLTTDREMTREEADSLLRVMDDLKKAEVALYMANEAVRYANDMKVKATLALNAANAAYETMVG